MRKLYLLLVVALALSVSGAVFADDHGSGSGKMHEAMAKLEMEGESGNYGRAQP